MEFGKMVMTILHAGQQRRPRLKNRLLASVREGEGGVI